MQTQFVTHNFIIDTQVFYKWRMVVNFIRLDMNEVNAYLRSRENIVSVVV